MGWIVFPECYQKKKKKASKKKTLLEAKKKMKSFLANLVRFSLEINGTLNGGNKLLHAKIYLLFSSLNIESWQKLPLDINPIKVGGKSIL